MATNTYVALQTVTLTSPASNVVFSSIPQTYTDLVLVTSARDTRTELNDGFAITFNTDTSTSSTNYSDTYAFGGGASKASGRNINQRNITVHQVTGNSAGSTTFATGIVHIQNYSNTTTFKTVLNRGGTDTEIYMASGLWRNTAAISTMTLYPGYNGSGYTFTTGSTFNLYGIAAEGTTPAVKAIGGIISADDTYYYHTFTSSGIFTPLQSLSCNYVVVAGGAGGGSAGGGGGAGGLRSSITTTGGGGTLESPLSLSATNYTVTVGAGGAGRSGSDENPPGFNGSNSVFASITSTGGGGGGSRSATPSNTNGQTGGSGGGGNLSLGTGGAGTTNQGYAGGNGSGFNSGAGGGAGAVGANGGASGAGGGVGGAGVANVIAGVSTFYAGGGGGGTNATNSTQFPAGGIGGGGAGGGGGGNGESAATAGTANTGGGGGGGGIQDGGIRGASAAGGSGIVVIRYAKA